MRLCLVIFCSIILAFHAVAHQSDLLKVRDLYYRAATDEDEADVLHFFLQSKPDISNVLKKGYMGMYYMLKANEVWNPYRKYELFCKGKECLEAAIRLDPANTELRFLRFGVQTNLPFFLGYSNDINKDKALIAAAYATLDDADLKTRIKNYIHTSAHCSEEYRAMFR